MIIVGLRCSNPKFSSTKKVFVKIKDDYEKDEIYVEVAKRCVLSHFNLDRDSTSFWNPELLEGEDLVILKA